MLKFIFVFLKSAITSLSLYLTGLGVAYLVSPAFFGIVVISGTVLLVVHVLTGLAFVINFVATYVTTRKVSLISSTKKA